MSQTRFEQKFTEQIGFMTRSAQLYDDGHEDEAFRLATSLRILLHDTPTSISLFKHTGRTKERLLTSSRGIGNWQDYLSHHLNPNSSEPVRMLPLLGDQFSELPIEDWWSTEPVFVHNGTPYTRKTIVLSAANKDGGAHVDARLQPYYETLLAGEYALGFTRETHLDGGPPTPVGVTVYPSNAHLALLRQFAHEMLASTKHFGW